jgi:aryl-alcohol dehydrogenase-like predicted oxidoreductase
VSMEERNVGKSGLRVSVIGLGCNNFGHRLDLIGTRGVVHRALDLGITLFDTADIYGDAGASESYLGQILGDRRRDIVLATKFGMAP